MNREALERMGNTIESRLRNENIKSKTTCKGEDNIVLKSPNKITDLEKYLPEKFLYNGKEYTISRISEKGTVIGSEFDISPGFYKYKLQAKKVS